MMADADDHNPRVAGSPPSQASSTVAAVIALTATAMLWGSNYVVARAVHTDIPLPTVVLWRWVLSLVVLTPLAWPTLRKDWPNIRANLLFLICLGMIGVGLFSIFLLAGAYHSTALEVGLLNSTTPIWVVFLSYALGMARSVWLRNIGVVTALAGTCLILFKGTLGNVFGLQFQLGNVWSLIAAILFAWYTVALKFRTLNISVLSLTTIAAWSGVIGAMVPFYLHFLATGGTDPFLSGEAAPNTIIAMLYLALGPTLIANLLWIFGATRLGAARAGPFLYLSPITSTVLAALFLGEQIAWFHLVGFALILLGLYLTNRAEDAPRPS